MGNMKLVIFSAAFVVASVLSLAAEPLPPSKEGQAVSFETIKGKDGAPMILIPA